MRFCADDWILSVWVYKTTRTRFDIGLFLYADHTKYKKDAGLRAALGMCLSEAYNRIGKMELHFTGRAKEAECTLATGYEPVVPASIRRLADDLKVGILGKNVISDQEGQRLYLRITGFSKTAEEIFNRRRINGCRAAFLTQRGIWSKEQVEFLAKEAIAPERLFDGGISPEFRLAYLNDLLVLRMAIMAERAQKLIEIMAEVDESLVEAQWVSSLAQEYRCPKAFSVPVGGEKIPVAAGTPITVLMFPKDAFGYGNCDAAALPDAVVQRKPSFLAVTKDFDWALPEIRDRLTSLGLIPLPIVDTLTEIDNEIEHRLARAASTKRPMPEKPD